MHSCNNKNNSWGGFRRCAGRKKTCANKVPFYRRINEDVLNILRAYAQKHDMTETEALESAIMLQSNYEILNAGKIMKIVIPTKDGKLCLHFGNCESFCFVEADKETKEILNMENKVPDEGISCQSASWIASKGANVVLAGGMGGRPLNIFAKSGVKVIVGCPELPLKEVIEKYLNNELELNENLCQGEHQRCQNGNGCQGHGHGKRQYHNGCSQYN